MADVKLAPLLGGGSKGKGTDDPIRFLPVLPSKRSKPAWQDNPPSFILTSRVDEEGSNTIDLIGELTARDVQKRKKPSRLKPIEGSSTQVGELESFKQPKKDREQFRKALVDIILQDETVPTDVSSAVSEDVPGTSRAGSPTPAEKDILRYYYYIHNGIDTEHVAPMEDSWLENVLALVPSALKEGHTDIIENLSDEMREDYLLSVKKAIVDFVLRDPRQVSDEEEEIQLPHRQEMAVVPKPWKRSFLTALGMIIKNLHSTNPCMMQVLNLWHVSYSGLRFIDVEEFHNREESMELKTFQSICMRQIDSVKEKLLKKWFPEIQTIFYQGNKRKLVPSNQEQDKLEAFFNCAAMLMTEQLQDLTLKSISDYTDLICQPPTSVRAFEHSGFILRLILEEGQIKFEPPFADFELVLLNVYEVIVKAACIVPRVETKLYSEWQGNRAKAFLKPVILDEILHKHKQKVSDLIKKESAGPAEFCKVYDKYAFLISKQAETDVEKFMEDETNTFDQFCKEVLRYKSLMEEIAYNLQKVIRLSMFEVHCDELIRALSKRADSLRNKLLLRMCRDHQEANKVLCEDYEAIAEKALTTPANTEELMALKSYIEKIESDTIFVMEKRLMTSKERLTFLSDHAQFSPAEMRLNSQVFMWHGRMPAVFEEHKLIMTEKRAQYEEGLRLRRERFLEELESYAKQVEEFHSFGEMADVPKYLKKAQTLDNKLQLAADKVDAFNLEEEAFGWQTTQYPQRLTVINVLKPYLNLYELTVDFTTKYKDWMEGPMVNVNPDQVENEVGNVWRSLYKLEKGFEAAPAPKKIATKIKGKVEEFKEHLPLVQTLFNPGLRDRHWSKISEIVGYTVRPDDSSCLSKFIDMNLTPFVSKFESISEAASKEYALEKALETMKKEWAPFEFTIHPYRETGTYILSSIDDIQQQLDDHIVKTQTMRGSPFIQPFEAEMK